MILEGTKVCPQCSETIQEQAFVCHYCGYDYRTGNRQGPKSVNGMAVASMVLGILWIYWVGSILALVFGYIARKQIDKSSGTQSGRGMAIAGIVLGWVGIGTLAFFVVVAIISAATNSF